MAAPAHKRSKSDPPPITVEDTATGAAPQPSPSPTLPFMTEQSPSFNSYTPQRPPAPQHTDSQPHLRQRRNSTWPHKRKPNHSLTWHVKWDKSSWTQGRVLLIDYVAKEHTASGRRKIVAQEFDGIDGLRNFYKNDALAQQAALRVIHVQNAPWAKRFLLRKFNITADDELVGTSFGRWARYDKPKVRGQGKNAKPVLSGKTFRATKDPWRGISRACFGFDYLRHYDKDKIEKNPQSQGWKMMELNHYDDYDNPAYGFDIYAQRLSVYVQLKDGKAGEPEKNDPDIRNPYSEETHQDYQRLSKQYGSIDANGHEKYIPKLQTLDNGSTIILFETSQSGSINDTLIGARQEIESRWRRLSFYLEEKDAETDSQLAIESLDLILKDIFKAVAFSWEKYTNLCDTHVSILEEKIYENPADESRAPELWTNSSLWLKVERCMYTHTDVVKDLRNELRKMANEAPEADTWLDDTYEELEKFAKQFQEGVVKPTANLSDLMYKSVGIRDARHSLQLGLSMWRLSWITFIFLPLTFVSGFFGMNVDAFEGNPSIKWWFITTVPLFVIVVTLWYGVKHSLTSQQQNPLRRGVYESLFYEFSKGRPDLWTRRGPIEGVVTVGWFSGVKWRLMSKWFDPERTIAVRDYDPGDEELGRISRFKRYLAKKWLGDITVLAENAKQQLPGADGELDLEATLPDPKDIGAVGELIELVTPVAVADADPTAASRIRQRLPLERFHSLSPIRSGGGARPGSRNSGKSGGSSGDAGSGVMVEEKSEDERSGDEGDDGEGRETGLVERLNVPGNMGMYPGR